MIRQKTSLYLHIIEVKNNIHFMINSQNIPHLIKYMGAKREILEYVTDAIQNIDTNSEWLCDLFSGTSVVTASLRDEYNIHTNDIQQYSSIFSNTYLLNLNRLIAPQQLQEIEERVSSLVTEFKDRFPQFKFDYSEITNYLDLAKLEKGQQNLIHFDFGIGFNLFTKYYSGTYWSYEQCIWIDSIRAIAEDYIGTPSYYVILSALIFAMSYSSQSTGHFAQYRDVTESNMNDILIYRHKNIWNLFSKKFEELISTLNLDTGFEYKVTSLDYMDCLRVIEENSIVYADPPYSTVHYSRFYHVIETLVRYDHPIIKYKGRYREDRHQSPFDKKTEVKNAFKLLFEGVKNRKSHLVLSYSNNGMISQEDILNIGNSIFGKEYECNLQSKEYIHSKMGRSDEYQLDVNELIISYKKV